MDKYEQEAGGQAAELVAAQCGYIACICACSRLCESSLARMANPERKDTVRCQLSKGDWAVRMTGLHYGDFVQLLSNGQVFPIPEMTTFNLSVDYNFNMIGDIDSRIRFGMNNVQDERAPLADDSFGYFADQHRDLGRYYYVDLRFRLLVSGTKSVLLEKKEPAGSFFMRAKEGYQGGVKLCPPQDGCLTRAWYRTLALVGARLGRCLEPPRQLSALSSGSAMADFCESDSALIDDNFSGGNHGVCEFTSPSSVSFTITTEDAPPINPSAWYSFRVSPKEEESLQLILNFVDGHARYWPNISSDGETWRRLDESQVDISEDRSTMTIALARSRDPIFVSAQELLVNDDYERWMHSLAEHPEVMSRTLGRSIQGRPIQALTTALKKAEVVYLFGRQHPPEITGGLAMQSFVDEVFSDSDLANEFRARFMLVLVPLINPDGVAAGRWRHNMGGRDLNRDWGPFHAARNSER